MYNNPHLETGEPSFIIKLPFSTNSQRIKRGNGVSGIMRALADYIKDDGVWGYIPSALIQPEVSENAECKVICFNGKAQFRNAIKMGKGGRSPFGRTTDRVFFAFAEHAIATLKRLCPAVIADQVLRVDMFGFRHRPGEFIVNEIEGYESSGWGVGTRAGDHVGRVLIMHKDHWKLLLYELINYHLDQLHH